MASFSTIRAPRRLTLAGFVVSVLWTALLSRFAAEGEPAPRRPGKAAGACPGSRYGRRRAVAHVQLRADSEEMWASEFKMLWLAILATALENLVWLSLFVFLLSVWRYRARAAEVSGQDVP